ncbi:IS110 family transposase [Chryseobacterium vaccae]|uniref:IS110 family transposase n=1 Tax=Chryseobacterium vaccae TaxID=2604424 RepID=UPI00162715B9|nr:transposase [Chryseobacterium vaccae]
MRQKYVIGIDISKLKLDCTVMNFEYKVQCELIIPNTEKGITIFLKDLLKMLKITKEDLLICCENTGIYNRPLEKVCSKSEYLLWVEYPLKIKKAASDLRGKDDRKDARKIAEYAVRYHDKIMPYEEPEEVIQQMNVLAKSRDTLLLQKTALENQLREAKSHDVYVFKLLTYYQRKVEQGKNKMSVLNAVRNKLVHRIMAVIKRKQPFLPKEEFLSIKNSNNICLLT